MTHVRSFFRIALTVVAGALVTAQPAAGGPILTARAQVNGAAVVTVPATGIVRRTAGAKGVALAGAEIYNPFKGDYRVSVAPGAAAGNKAANQAQKDGLRTLLSDVLAIQQAGKKPKALKEARDKLEDDVDGLLLAGTFPNVEKEVDKPLLAETDELENKDAVERARALARQTLTKVNNTAESPLQYKPEEKLTAQVVRNKVKDPRAAALGMNSDPLAIEWADEAGLRVDFSDLWLEAETLGDPSGAVALFSSHASFLNGTLDVERSGHSSRPLYEFRMFVASFNGGEVVFDVFLDSFGNKVVDSLGNIGLQAVQAALLDQLSVTPSRVGFKPGYFFDVVIPDEPAQSVLYLRDVGAAATQVPEPASVWLVGLGLLAGACRRRLRGAQAISPQSLRQ